MSSLNKQQQLEELKEKGYLQEEPWGGLCVTDAGKEFFIKNMRTKDRVSAGRHLRGSSHVPHQS